MENNQIVIDFSKKVSRKLKKTRLNTLIDAYVGDVKYITNTGDLAVIIPVYRLKKTVGEEKAQEIDAAQLAYSIVQVTLLEDASFQAYIKKRGDQTGFIDTVTDTFADGFDDIGTKLMSGILPMFMNKQHMIDVELYKDSNDDNEISWEEFEDDKVIKVSVSQLNGQNMTRFLPQLTSLFNSGGGAGANTQQYLRG